jgi:endonuclease/exonuclease/phosphatase family metal-dependent hydrolase
MKMILWSMFALVGLLLLFLAWAGHPWSLNPRVLTGEVETIEPETLSEIEEHPSVIKVLSWNLGFLYGEGSEGPGYETKERSFYEEKLERIVKEIAGWEPDILFLQEIDFSSARSHDIDQAKFIAQRAGYPYIAPAVSWEANYIPFPYWPMRNNFGRVRSGGAVLSKFPIISNEVHLLAKPRSQPWWYNIFYLHRYFQRVKIEIGEKQFQVANLHLEAFDKRDRQGQIELLREQLTNSPLDIIAGDFNMLPASASRRSRFQDSKDDYEDDTSYELMMKSGLLEVVPDEIYATDEALYFTFPSSRPDRRLDYIFYRPELKMMKAEVLPSALSDHLPIRATFQIDSPKINPYSL